MNGIKTWDLNSSRGFQQLRLSSEKALPCFAGATARFYLSTTIAAILRFWDRINNSKKYWKFFLGGRAWDELHNRLCINNSNNSERIGTEDDLFPGRACLQRFLPPNVTYTTLERCCQVRESVIRIRIRNLVPLHMYASVSDRSENYVLVRRRYTQKKRKQKQRRTKNEKRVSLITETFSVNSTVVVRAPKRKSFT